MIAGLLESARLHGVVPSVVTRKDTSFRVLEKLGFRRAHSDWDERGELVWNVRDLSRPARASGNTA